MSQLNSYIKSAAKLGKGTVQQVSIGKPGTPNELVIYNGKIYVYDTQGQSLIDGGLVSANGFSAHSITTNKLSFTGQKFIHTIIFTADDYNTVSWSSGVIKFADGTSKNIYSGNSGNITVKTYIYYNGTSTLQKTIYSSIAIMSNNILLEIIEPNSDTSQKCNMVSFIDNGTTIDGNLITTGKIQPADGHTYFDLDNNVIIINDGTYDRILIGKIGATTYGIKVSKPGFDVKTATDDQLVMSSEFLSLKIAHSDAPISNGNYPHNLGYAPAFFVSAKKTYGENSYWGFVGQEQDSIFELSFASDSTKFYYGSECRYFLIYQDTL